MKRLASAVLSVAGLLAAVAACGEDGQDRSGASSVTLPSTVPVSEPRSTTSSTTNVTSSDPTTADVVTTDVAASIDSTTTPTVDTEPPTPPPGEVRPEDVSTQLTPVADIDQPIDLTMRPGDDTTIYVAQRTGTIVKLNAGTVSDPILDLSAETTTDAERGLLGIAFSADGSFLYVNFTDRNGASHVEEFAVDRTGNPDSSTRRLLLTQDQPYRNHNGGGIVVGPDGMLYIGFGDGGSAGDPERRALRADTWLGKLLRIDPRAGDETRPYGIPNDNPFVGTPGVLPEIWSLGLRNPWRFSFDPSTGDLWIGDVGQNEWEEVDWAPASSGAGRGVSFGWSAFEATHRYNDDQPSDGHVLPVFEYPHGSMGVSVTGGVVYRGTALPALRGAYVYGDYGFNGLRAIALAGDSVRTEVTLAEGARTVVDIDAGPDGEIYVAALEQGQVLRLDPA